jgi:hypothetical protein
MPERTEPPPFPSSRQPPNPGSARVAAKCILEHNMKLKIILAATAVLLALPIVSNAQGVVRGAEDGIREGDRAAGPVGGVVGGAVGAVTGGVAGLLGIDQRPRFKSYVVHEHHDSYAYDHPVAVGAVLPDGGLNYYDVPPEYGVADYRYAIINNQTVLIDPRTHRIVQIVD